MTKNVAELVRLPSGRTRQAQAWSSDEARAFLESARADSHRFYAAYVLVLVLALRKGEVLGLLWEDRDLEGAAVTVSRQLERVRRQLLHRETKTEASDATLPLPDICTAAFRQQATNQVAARERFAAAWHESGFVITVSIRGAG